MMAVSKPTNSKSATTDNQARAERILRLKIEFIESDEFESMLAAKSHGNVLEQVPQNGSSLNQDLGKTEIFVDPAHAESTPLRSFAEEQHEFRRMNFLKFEANRLRSTLTAQSADLKTMNEIERLLREAKQVRDQIVEANLGLVFSNARKYCTPTYGFDDLVSDGSLALLESVEKFNYSLGFRFSTYVTHSIRRSFFRKIEKCQTDRKRFAVTDPDLMALVPHVFEVNHDLPHQNRLMDFMAREFSVHLTDRECQIIECRFGLNGRGETQSLKQLSSEMGICKERVRQIEKAALSKLHAVAAKYSDFIPPVESA